MDSINDKQDKLELEIELQIEELEERIAPDGGETVLPLSAPKFPFKKHKH